MNIIIDVDYRSKLSPVRDQGARPTCLSFASTTAHEYARSSSMPLSPEYLHHFASSGSASDGVQFSDIAHVLENSGQPTEVDCPYYTAGLPFGWTPPKSVSLYKRKSKSMPLNVDQITAMLTARQIPIAGITVPQSFYFPTPPWVISPNGPIRGHHAVAIVGFGARNTTRCFLVRNSWGTAWGDSGYAWLEDAFLHQHLNDLLVLTDEVI